MRTDQFDYHLPPHLIAQHPLPERDQSRLMVVHRSSGSIRHAQFRQLPELLSPGDVIVLNDTRVVPARLLGHRARTGGKWEGLFLQQLPGGDWELLCQTRGRLMAGEVIAIDPGPLRLSLMGKTGAGHWVARPDGEHATLQDTFALLQMHGYVPLPPYIRKGTANSEDRERYQTVFAERQGAVAAPTAGLHFTKELLERLTAAGITQAFATLHVGAGTFQPIQTKLVADHKMHSEWGELSTADAESISTCKKQGHRVGAVGTTSVRLLETVAATGGIRPWSGQTELFIYPPYRFQAVDALITNFHLPRSSLLVLVSAFGGIDLIREAYKKAIEAEYRFYSYGDAMLIL